MAASASTVTTAITADSPGVLHDKKGPSRGPFFVGYQST